jgi:hypothetical protein
MRLDDTLHDDTGGFEVGHAMVGAVPHEDRLREELDEGARLLWKPAIGGLVPIDHEVIGCVTLRADYWGFERAMKGAARQFAYRVGARTNCCNPQVHSFLGYHCVPYSFRLETGRRLAEGVLREWSMRLDWTH